MAGDWIKIEHALPGKPEVWQVADELGISVNETLGLLVRFWTWVDQQMSLECHAVYGTNVRINEAVGRDGFAQAMVRSGWLWIENNKVAIPNYDEHLSESAKERALASKRKKRQRSKASRKERDICHAPTVTRREKRREESSSSVSSKQQSSVSAALKKQIAKLDLTVEDLSDTSKLVNAKLLGEEPESNLNVVAAACHILHQMKKKKLPSPIGLFSAIVADGRWGDITDTQMEEARGKIKQIRNGHGGTEWAKRLAGSIAGGGAARPGEEP